MNHPFNLPRIPADRLHHAAPVENFAMPVQQPMIRREHTTPSQPAPARA